MNDRLPVAAATPVVAPEKRGPPRPRRCSAVIGCPRAIGGTILATPSRVPKQAAQAKPLALVLDDLHWSDKPSLLLLEFLGRELRDARIFVVGTYREAEARQASPLAEELAAIARLGRHLAMAVKTGNFCCYTPDPRSPISWSR